MRRIAHTLTIIRFWQKQAGLVDPQLLRDAKRLRVRLPGSLAKAVTANLYHNRANDLLRDLTPLVPKRDFLSRLYHLFDASEKQAFESRTASDLKKAKARLKLDARFKQQNPERYQRLSNLLLDEARLFDLKLPPAMLRDHCHHFKHYFDWSSPKKLKLLLALGEEEFNLLVYHYLSSMALAADSQKSKARFDWKKFGSGGFNQADYRVFLDDRKRFLDILGLPRDADLALIRQRYKELAKRHHPDLGGDLDRMRELNEAYKGLIE